tara:strand:- start:9080 stop:10327 length:1248 start_codon:yes stop_codon:yes gene_type:complete
MRLNFLDINKSSFLSNSFYLYLSHFSDYLLGLFLLPYVAKTVGSIEFGRIGLIQAYGLLIILLMDFGSSLIATREVAKIKGNINRLREFFREVTILKIYLLPIAIIISLLMIVFVPVFNAIPHYVGIVVLGSTFQGILPTWYFQGIEKMRIIAISKIFFRLIGFLIIIFFVKSSRDGWIVLASFSFSSALICLYLYYEVLKQLGLKSFYNLFQAKLIFSKSIPSFLITIIPLIYQNISMITLSFFISPIQLGLFFGANRIYKAFNSLFSPISQAFFPLISSLKNQNIKKSKLLMTYYLILITIIGSLFFLINNLFTETIISLLLGEKFSDAGNLLRLFSIVLPLTAVSNALGRQWLMAINKEFFYSVIQLASSIIAFIVFLLSIKAFGIYAMPISLIVYEGMSIAIISIFLVSND